MSSDQTGEQIKQKAYVFILSIPHVPNHSADVDVNLGLHAHKARYNPVLSQIKSKTSNGSPSSDSSKRATVLNAVNEGLAQTEDTEGASRTLAEAVQDILDQNKKYITTPMWLPNLPPSVLKGIGNLSNQSNDEVNGENDDSKETVESKDSLSNIDEKSQKEVHGMILIFTTQYVELILKRLSKLGLGKTPNGYGTISIFPTSLHRHAKEGAPKRKDSQGNGTANSPTGVTTRNLSEDGKRGEEEEDDSNAVDENFVRTFVESINSRVIVEEVIENVHSAASFTFDYLLLVLVASMIAGVGLAVDSTVSVVASMLVSPIMGPILAITFGMTTNKPDLIRVGIRSEIISLLLCIFMGFIISLVFTAMGGPRIYEWPTENMAGRGKSLAILESIFIALPSGIGVALSVLGNNTSSLVGVAISASLLPPAVNTGMLLGYALLVHLDPLLETSLELGMMAMWSFLLTMVNIFIIIIMALLFFWIKEVVTIPGESMLWSNDIQVYKNTANVYKKGEKDAEQMAKLAKLMATMGGKSVKKPRKSNAKKKPTPKKRRQSAMEIFGNLNLPPTPASEKANAAYNAFTVAQAKGHNPHHAMINALTVAHRSGNKNLTKKRTAQAGLFAKNRKGGSMSESKNMAPMKSLANILDAPHVELANLFAPPPSEDEVDEIEDMDQTERDVFSGNAHQSTNSIFDPVTPSTRITDKTSDFNIDD